MKEETAREMDRDSTEVSENLKEVEKTDEVIDQNRQKSNQKQGKKGRYQLGLPYCE